VTCDRVFINLIWWWWWWQVLLSSLCSPLLVWGCLPFLRGAGGAEAEAEAEAGGGGRRRLCSCSADRLRGICGYLPPARTAATSTTRRAPAPLGGGSQGMTSGGVGKKGYMLVQKQEEGEEG
jgi:hypothetical protein